MAAILNYDCWNYSVPETMKFIHLVKGDEVPDEILNSFEDTEPLFAGRNPVLLKKDDARESKATQAQAPTPKAEDKK